MSNFPGKSVALISAIAFAANLPLGMLRADVEKFSPSWFIYIHASVPLIIYLRRKFNVPRMAIPINIASAVLGQLIGDQIPSARQGHVATIYNNHYYIFGGRTVGKGRVYTNDIWCFSLTDYTWRKIEAKNSPSARHNHSAILHNNKWIIFGGQDSTGKLNEIWQFDLTTNEWLLLTAKNSPDVAPSPRHAHTAVLYNNNMVVFGGCDDKNIYKNDVWALNMDTLTWEQWVEHNAKSKPIGRSWHAAVMLKNRMIISGGYWWDGHEHYCGDFYEFDCDLKLWREVLFNYQISRLPHARNRQSVTSQGRPMMIYMYGNWYNDVTRKGNFYNDTYVFVLNEKDSTWSILGNDDPNSLKIVGKTPEGRCHQTVVALNDKQLYLFGGEANRKRFNDIYLIEMNFLI